MGKHQWLENGNLLITESRAGRAFEIDPGGRPVREYQNALGGRQAGYAGMLGEVERLPARFDRRFFARMDHSCPAARVP